MIASQTHDIINNNERAGAITYEVISENNANANIATGNIFSATAIGDYTIRATKAQTDYYNEVTDDIIPAADIPESPWTAETPQASDTAKTAVMPQAYCRTETADSLMERILHDDTIGGFLWNKLFRKSLIDRGGMAFSKNIFVGEDLLFVEQYLAGCRTVRITDQKLYNYYTSGDSISSAMNEKTLTLLRALEKISGLSDRPSFVKAAALRYIRQFLSFAAYFPDRQCPPGRLSSFLKNTGLTRKEVFAGLTKNYKIKYVLYNTNRSLYRKIMSFRKKAE